MDKCKVIGTCWECNQEVWREYSYITLKGLSQLSDGYLLKMRNGCICDDKEGGNVRRDTIKITELVRDSKISEILK